MIMSTDVKADPQWATIRFASMWDAVQVSDDQAYVVVSANDGRTNGMFTQTFVWDMDNPKAAARNLIQAGIAMQKYLDRV